MTKTIASNHPRPNKKTTGNLTRHKDKTNRKTTGHLTRSPQIVTECLLNRSMLIKMYVYAIFSRFRIGTILSISMDMSLSLHYHYRV